MADLALREAADEAWAVLCAAAVRATTALVAYNEATRAWAAAAQAAGLPGYSREEVEQRRGKWYLDD